MARVQSSNGDEAHRDDTLRALVQIFTACPHCGSLEVRPSGRRRFRDYLALLVFLTPWRCEKCRKRFYRFPRLGQPRPRRSHVSRRSRVVRPVPAHYVVPEPPTVLADPPTVIESNPLPVAAALPEFSVLLLVNDREIGRLLRRVLEHAGYRVEDLPEGGQAWDLIIADLDRTTDETILWIESLAMRSPATRIIALSSGPRVVTGSWRLLSKPFGITALLDVASQTLASRVLEDSFRSRGRRAP